ncbi:MAG TPA: amino acid ABC transporter permease/ATP-binding protein [Paenalcaligenes sp.]|nr:amino acid ABC transporter permease/ATP-binding protein [Paenalcaligenes sp.]
MDFDWGYTLGLLKDRDFWYACLTVAQLSISAWLIAGIIGFLLALAKQSAIKPINWAANTYIWFFRSLPLLVLLVFVYNLPQIFPASSILLRSPFYAGLVALVVSETAYMAEIHRGGIMSVPQGQVEAGKALGLRYGGIQRLIVIPQAIRIALPTLSNQFVTIVKLTSLVSVISLTEILLVGQRLYTQNFLIFETMLAVAFYYVVVVTLFDRVLVGMESSLDIRRKKTRPLQLSEHTQQSIDKVLQHPLANTAAAQQDNAAQPLDDTTTSNQKTPDATPILSIHNLNKYYGDYHALKDINLEVHTGDVISIIGASGSGKTSLIRCLNGLEDIDSGRILLKGAYFLGPDDSDKNSQQNKQILDIGMVFQNFNLFAHKTALENVLLALNYHRRGTPEQRRVEALAQLKRVGLLEFAHQYPHSLSGGQQQRVAIARALAMRPSIMLFDEPTSALDPELVSEVLKVIEQLAAEKMTMLIVTHEMQFAFSVSNRIWFMQQGQVIHDSTPKGLKTSDDQRVKDFIYQITN